MRTEIETGLCNGGTKTCKYHYLYMTPEEYEALFPFFLTLGVELRSCIYSSEEVKVQVRNTYKAYCSDSSNGKRIREDAEEAIRNGVWRR